MLFNLILGAIAGYFSGQAEKVLDDPLKKRFSLSDRDMHLIGFSLVLVVAAVLLSALDIHTRVFWLLLGGLVGVFGNRILAYSKTQVGDRKTKAVEKFDEASQAAERASSAAAKTASETVTTAKTAVKKTATKAKTTAKKATTPKKPTTPKNKAP